MSLIHTRLPRGGRVGRVLPAADAVAAKAEGVDFGVAGILSVAGNFQYVVLRGFPAAEGNFLALQGLLLCLAALRPKATPSVSRLRREPAPSRGSLGVVLPW